MENNRKYLFTIYLTVDQLQPLCSMCLILVPRLEGY